MNEIHLSLVSVVMSKSNASSPLHSNSGPSKKENYKRKKNVTEKTRKKGRERMERKRKIGTEKERKGKQRKENEIKRKGS